MGQLLVTLSDIGIHVIMRQCHYAELGEYSKQIAAPGLSSVYARTWFLHMIDI
jgi:hypothetical protein